MTNGQSKKHLFLDGRWMDGGVDYLVPLGDGVNCIRVGDLVVHG